MSVDQRQALGVVVKRAQAHAHTRGYVATEKAGGRAGDHVVGAGSAQIAHKQIGRRFKSGSSHGRSHAVDPEGGRSGIAVGQRHGR